MNAAPYHAQTTEQVLEALRVDPEQGLTPDDDPLYHRCLEIGALCNNATVRYNEADDTIEDAQGDPTEIALLAGAERRGVHRAERLARKPEAREVAFDADLMMMATVHESDNAFERAVTVSFLTLGFAKLWFVFNLRDRGSTLLHNDIVSNRWIWTALSACALLLLAAVYVPGVVSVLETASPGARGWVVVLALSAIPLLSGQIRLAARGAPETVSEAQSNGRPERAAPALPDEGTS